MSRDHEVPRHQKKKKSNTSDAHKKSDHKHEYVECLFEFTIGKNNNKECAKGEYCKICGKIGKKNLWENELIDAEKRIYHVLTYQEVKNKYKDLQIIELEDYFYQSFISIEGRNT